MTNEDRKSWLAERRSGIGGSDVAGILGISPWSTPVTVWLEKTGRADDKEETESMRIGTELEDYVARSYERETGRKVNRFNTMIHKGCLLGNFDRLVIPEGKKYASYKGEVRTDLLLECKTSSRKWEDGVPLYYQTQVQHYMGLVDALQHADVACLNLVAKEFKIYRVDRDQEAIDDMQEYLTAWWEKHIIKGDIPEATCEDDVKRIWKRSHEGKTVIANNYIDEAISRMKKISKAEDEIKSEKTRLRNEITAYMGDAESIIGINGNPLVTWKSAKDTVKSVIDWKAIAEELAGGIVDAERIKSHTIEEVNPGLRRFLVK